LKKKERPLVIVKEVKKSLILSDLGEEEKALGLHEAMPLSTAQIIVPHLNYLMQNDDYAHACLLRLATLSFIFSPQIALDNLGILMNITGCSHLFGGDMSMIKSLETFFLEKGLKCRIGLAHNPLLAKATSLFAQSISSDLKSLPLTALFVPESIINTLHSLEIFNMGTLLSFSRPMLAKRFGLGFINRIDELCGIVIKTPSYLTEQYNFSIIKDDQNIRSHDYFMLVLKTMIKIIFTQLRKYYFLPKEIIINCSDSYKKHIIFKIAVTFAHNRMNEWLELIFLRTQQHNFMHGIEKIHMTCSTYELYRDSQDDFSKKTSSHMRMSASTDKLKSLLGNNNIFFQRVNNNNTPEKSCYKDISLIKKDNKKQLLPPRPIHLLQKAIPVKAIALEPDNPPARIMWQNKVMNIVHASGPERISDAWWLKKEEPPRDYFCVESEKGQRLWLYASGEPKNWFLHGFFA
jgi:protein ImuB